MDKSKLPKWVKYTAVDADGHKYGFKYEPSALVTTGKWGEGGNYFYIGYFPYEAENWKDSLEQIIRENVVQVPASIPPDIEEDALVILEGIYEAMESLISRTGLQNDPEETAKLQEVRNGIAAIESRIKNKAVKQ